MSFMKIKIKESFLSNPYVMRINHIKLKDKEDHQELKVQQDDYLKKQYRNQKKRFHQRLSEILQ